MALLPFKTVWITGASSGIGEALATYLAAQGCEVAVSARSAEKLDGIAADAASRGQTIVPVPLDVTDAAACRAAGDTVRDRFGGSIDLVVLNAGTYLPVEAASFDAGMFARQVDINLTGTGNMLAAVMPAMIDRKGGQIAVVASVAGYRGLPTSAAYGATKAALINLCEALKFDLDRAGVKMQLVNPGFIKTPLTDKNQFAMPFLMPVDKAVRAMVRGLCSSRFEITFPKRFTWQMKLLRLLPYALYFPLTRLITRA